MSWKKKTKQFYTDMHLLDNNIIYVCVCMYLSDVAWICLINQVGSYDYKPHFINSKSTLFAKDAVKSAL